MESVAPGVFQGQSPDPQRQSWTAPICFDKLIVDWVEVVFQLGKIRLPRRVTPPIGMCLNAGSKVCGLSIVEIFKGAAPYLICNVIVLLLVTFIPALSDWLPGVLM